jgi:hypothetical protein
MRLRPVTVESHIFCRYTSVPERMGEEVENTSAADTPDELHRRDEARRLREQAEQAKAMGVLHDLETAAVQANPEAGHPEYRRALDATDYPSPATRPAEPAGTGNWIEPQVAHGLPWLGVGSTGDDQQQHQQQGARGDMLHDDANTNNTPSKLQQQAGDGIYDDDSQFEAWFNKP